MFLLRGKFPGAKSYITVFQGSTKTEHRPPLAISLGVAALDIISIVDGVRVAKVKNMYEQDLRKAYSFDMSVCPSFDYAMVGNSYQPTAGLKLSVRF